MYYNDDMREGYYCDQCASGCCSNHWIICDPCMQQLRMNNFTANQEISRLKEEIKELLKKLEEKNKNCGFWGNH